jgi:hypothetical protein
MKPFLFLLFPLMFLHASATVEHRTLNGQDFTLITEDYDVYDSKGKVVKFYRDELNNDLTYLFPVTLTDKTGTCGARSLTRGAYEIKGKTITLYTFWDRQGRVYDTPYGARIQKYEVTKRGDLKLIGSKLYVETARKSFDPESGMRFLFTKPKNDKEKAALEAYVKDAERQYKGVFVFGDDAKALIQEVKAALDRKMKNTWKRTAAN